MPQYLYIVIAGHFTDPSVKGAGILDVDNPYSLSMANKLRAITDLLLPGVARAETYTDLTGDPWMAWDLRDCSGVRIGMVAVNKTLTDFRAERVNQQMYYWRNNLMLALWGQS